MSTSRRSFLKSIAGAAGSLPFLSSSSPAALKNAVPKRKFGRYDEMLSVVGFGGHTLKFAESKDMARNICHRAYDGGVNFFENSWDYHGGEAEEIMGYALEGIRENVFLMTKFCIYHSNQYSADKEGAMKMLEDSLRRMKTDYIDLWMLHNIKGDDAKNAYAENGALEALNLAREQGKIRYTGFTGHTTTAVHQEIINGGYEWDATLMPVSALGALSSRQFEKDLMPLCVEKNIAVLGMKGFGGSKRAHMHNKTNVEEVIRYALSYPQVCTHVIGIDKPEYADQAMAASSKTPMSVDERREHVARLSREGGALYAMYLDPEYDACYSCGGTHSSQVA